MRRKAWVGLGSVVLTVGVIEVGFRLVEGRAGVDRAKILALREFATGGSRLFSAYPYTNYTAKTKRPLDES